MNIDFWQALLAHPSKWRPWREPWLLYPRYATVQDVLRTYFTKVSQFQEMKHIRLDITSSSNPTFNYRKNISKMWTVARRDMLASRFASVPRTLCFDLRGHV